MALSATQKLRFEGRIREIRVWRRQCCDMDGVTVTLCGEPFVQDAAAQHGCVSAAARFDQQTVPHTPEELKKFLDLRDFQEAYLMNPSMKVIRFVAADDEYDSKLCCFECSWHLCDDVNDYFAIDTHRRMLSLLKELVVIASTCAGWPDLMYDHVRYESMECSDGSEKIVAMLASRHALSAKHKRLAPMWCAR